VTPPSGNSKQQLSDKASALLVQLWQRIQVDERRVTRVSLRKIAQQVSFDARKAGLRSEELIVAVKESWKSRDGINPAHDPRSSHGTVAEFISLCIAEFYGWSESDPAPESEENRHAPNAKPTKRNRDQS